MFREMRRKKQALSQEECGEILKRGITGVLALSGDDDFSYAVPINYVYDGEKIYFHSAKSGHKLDAIARNPKVSFCVVDKEDIVPEKYTTYFRSVIVFGTMKIMDDETEMRAAIEKLALKYVPDDTAENRKNAIDEDWAPLCMMELTPMHISGKEAIELVKARK